MGAAGRKRRMTREQQIAMFAKKRYEKQRSVAIAILKEHGIIGQKIKAFHGRGTAIDKLSSRHLKSLHVGTQKAAAERLHDTRRGDRGYVHEIIFSAGNPLLIKPRTKYHKKKGGEGRKARVRRGKDRRRMPLTILDENIAGGFPRLERISQNRKLRERLIKRGFDVVPYINSSEDRGRISWLLLTPKKARILKATTARKMVRSPYPRQKAKRTANQHLKEIRDKLGIKYKRELLGGRYGG